MNYRGKRLFVGRLFAGRLWGPPEVDSSVSVWPGSGVVRRKPAPKKRRRRDTDDDVLPFLLR